MGEGSPLTTFAAGDAVFLISLDRGTFRVVPDTEGVLACVVGETVHLLDFVSPRRALEALGLEPRDEPIPDGASFETRVADAERLAAHGVPCNGVGALVSVYGRSGGRWSISTFGRVRGSAEIDAWAFYAPRSPLGDALERATVVLEPGGLTEGGRLLARVAEPSRLASHGIRDLPPGAWVRLTRGPGTIWTLTTLSPGFTCVATLSGFDPEALGLEGLVLLDLPVGGSIRGRLRYAWKAAKEGLKGAWPRDRVQVLRQPDGAYLLLDLEPKRPVSTILAAGS